jgi:hypothetical protein
MKPIENRMKPVLLGTLLLVAWLGQYGCTPKIEVIAPSEPVTINLNVKIEHEIRVKIEKDLDEVFGEDSNLF